MEKIFTIPNGILALLVVGAVLGLVLTGNLYSKPTGDIAFTNEPEYNAFTRDSVYISGAVVNPGVYQFEKGMRVRDIVERAGGFSNTVDPSFVAKELNLSAKIEDQQHIFIPNEPDLKTVPNAPQIQDNKININTSTKDELDSLPGVGPVTADNIINNRPYSATSDLLKVPGIGNATLEKLLPLISI
jgi:competence protein ComEA